MHFFDKKFGHVKKKQYLCSRFSCKTKVNSINTPHECVSLIVYKQKQQMATKIRLARHGHKDYAYYHIVVADSRSPRDGKFIERIGSYNPNTNPATVDLKFDRALYWLGVGAQPTDTAKNILSGEGVLLMKHLLGGVKKGAFDEATAQKKFEAWKAQKDAKNGKISAQEAEKKLAAAKALLAQEVEQNKAKAAELAEKRKAAAEAEAQAALAAAKEAEAAVAEAEGKEAPAAE